MSLRLRPPRDRPGMQRRRQLDRGRLEEVISLNSAIESLKRLLTERLLPTGTREEGVLHPRPEPGPGRCLLRPAEVCQLARARRSREASAH